MLILALAGGAHLKISVCAHSGREKGQWHLRIPNVKQGLWEPRIGWRHYERPKTTRLGRRAARVVPGSPATALGRPGWLPTTDSGSREAVGGLLGRPVAKLAVFV